MKNLFFTLIAFLAAHAAFACSASFTYSVSGAVVSFTNTSTPPTYSGHLNAQVLWSYGDGTTGNPHTYALAGNHTVYLQMTWTDSFTHAVICADSMVQIVTTTVNGPAQITGNVYLDSSNANNPTHPAYKVWLIKYDATTQDLSAVDSVSVSGIIGINVPYTFNNPAAGSYRVKAALTNGPSSGNAGLPTYGYDSLYWHGATVITYSGSGVNSSNDIHLLEGTVMSGPGFVSGNVTTGANKGTKVTGLPAANVTVFLENMSGQPIAYTTTDANGNYQFSNFPAGTYKIYPEILSTATTPAIFTFASTPVLFVNFIDHTISKTVYQSDLAVANVSEANSAFNIFPNPTNGVLNISWTSKTPLQNALAYITDVAGRKVLETVLNANSTSGTTQLNISQVKAGIYFLNITADGVNYTSKVVLQN